MDAGQIRLVSNGYKPTLTALNIENTTSIDPVVNKEVSSSEQPSVIRVAVLPVRSGIENPVIINLDEDTIQDNDRFEFVFDGIRKTFEANYVAWEKTVFKDHKNLQIKNMDMYLSIPFLSPHKTYMNKAGISCVVRTSYNLSSAGDLVLDICIFTDKWAGVGPDKWILKFYNLKDNGLTTTAQRDQFVKKQMGILINEALRELYPTKTEADLAFQREQDKQAELLKKAQEKKLNEMLEIEKLKLDNLKVLEQEKSKLKIEYQADIKKMDDYNGKFQEEIKRKTEEIRVLKSENEVLQKKLEALSKTPEKTEERKNWEAEKKKLEKKIADLEADLRLLQEN